MDNRVIMAICIGIGIIIVGAIISGILSARDKAKKAEMGIIEEDLYEKEYTAVTVKATVTDQMCGVTMVGIKTPKTIREFVVVFETEDGDILKLNVPEEMYDGFETGQTGSLTLVDGTLYGFELE